MRPLTKYAASPVIAAIVLSLSAGCGPSDDASGSAGDEQDLTSVNVTSLAVGSAHTCALLSTGAVRCWGWNGYGQLGIGSWNQYPSTTPKGIPAVDLGPGRKAVAIGADSNRSCALLDDDSVACWGHKGFGPADVSPVFVRLDAARKAKTLSVGATFQCVLFDDASVKCWGDNSFGQLGRSTPSGEIGDPSGVSPIDLGGRVKQIQAGGRHACALLESGDVKCWGANEVGQLGLGDTKNRGQGFFSMGGGLRPVALGGHAVTITTGNDHSCALLDDLSIKCWGENAWGELGIGSENRVGMVEEDMGDHLAAVKLPPGLVASTVVAEGRMTCVSLLPANSPGGDHDDRVRRFACWGMNDRGQLGLGDKDPRGTKPEHMGSGLALLDLKGPPREVVPGGSHACALHEDGRVQCWGMNLYANLGRGTTGPDTDIGDQPGEMNDLPFVALDP